MLILRRIHFINSLLTKILIGIKVIKLEEIFIIFRRDAIITNFNNGIKVLVIITFKSEKSFTTIV